MFERPASGERAVLVHIDLGVVAEPDEVEEFGRLAEAAGAEIVGTLGGQRGAPDPKTFIGSGKCNELVELVASTGDRKSVV